MLHSYVIMSRLCAPNISWQYVSLLVKHPRATEMSEKCRKRPLLKNEDTKVLRHSEEYNYQRNDLHAIRNKID